MTDRAREIVERLREEARTIQSFSSIMVDPRATLLCKAADFIEQPLTVQRHTALSAIDSENERLREALAEIANARWPSVNGDDPVERIQAFARAALSSPPAEGEK